jgi:predicted RecA/RadA family phage recombinase
MNNQTQKGDALYATAPGGGFVSGNGYLIGAVFGIAGFSCAAGATGVLWLQGVYQLPKLNASAWAFGDPIYWDTGNNWCTNVEGTFRRIGTAADQGGSANPTASAQVRLDGLVPARSDGVTSTAAGIKIARGQATTASASDTIATGLATVVAVVVSEDDAPVIGAEWTSASIGDQAGAPVAGSFLLKTWKPTAANDATPIAATTFGKKVNWIAVGT